jgi:hypothetical protein
VGVERLDDAALWHEFVEGKQTYSEIGRAHGVSARTVQRRLTEYRPKEPEKEPREVVVLMDTTYWGREYGVMLFKDAVTNENLLKYFVTAETVEKYVRGITELGRRGYRVLGIVCDGRRGLFNAFPDIPIQMCQFHQQKTVRKYLTKHPKTDAAIELKAIVDMLTNTDKESFVGMFDEWCEKWDGYLKERTTDTETGKSHYTHKRLRSAYLSIKRNLPLLFTWYDYIEMGIPNTTNLIDGHFSHLKRMLRNHNGMTRERREKLVIGFFEASRGKSQ